MHGSLLPKYRGRVPINWAVIKGEKQTGATLHRMVEKPDAGEILAQQAVPILPDDTAHDVFQKVTVAAEIALDQVLPSLLAGTAKATPMQLTPGNYFGGRKPEDGRIDWTQNANEIHNLIRGVAPPYPGAFADVQGKRLLFYRSRIDAGTRRRNGSAALSVEENRVYIHCFDGRTLEILDLAHEGHHLDASAVVQLFGSSNIHLA
jgi:methionyl-tRNA formyltransferase